MTEHLELSHLKGFAARLHLAIHIGSHKKYLPAAKDVGKALEIFSDVLWHQRYETLEQAFGALQTEIDCNLELVGDVLPTDLKEGLKNLRRSLKESSCAHCKHKHQLTIHCLPHEKTYEKVSTAGECIAPVKDLCLEIYNWVKNEVFWPRNSAPGSAITLATTHRAFERQPEIVRRFAVGGWASVIKGKAPNTAVGIDIRERAFGWEQFCLLPYLLLHEIVCHGLQSLDGRGARINADSDDAWSEGWMDRLAYMLARQWFERQVVREILSSDDQDLAVKYSFDLHEARYEMEATSLGPRYGREVFDKVQKSYGLPITRVPFSRHPITQLSLRLNACTLSKDERLTLVRRFDTLATTDAKALHSVCAKFIAHQNIEMLRAALG